jgi:hypothetical protein
MINQDLTIGTTFSLGFVAFIKDTSRLRNGLELIGNFLTLHDRFSGLYSCKMIKVR